jgi:drug/metabolite transporter (DMT)-like permease
LPAHLIRSCLLVAEICLIVWGYTLIGLINSHAVFAICPLLIVALSGPMLGERISWQRWAAVAAGLLGVLIILRPGMGVFSWAALLPLAAAFLFAMYSVLTRLTTRDEPTFPAFFWPGVIGAVLRGSRTRAEERAIHERARDLLRYVGLEVRSNTLARNLPHGDQRRLEL